MGVTGFYPPSRSGDIGARSKTMAPKHDRTAFIFAMAATILAIMTWAAFPHESDLAAPVPPKHFTGLTGGSPPLSQNRLRGLLEARLLVFGK